MKKLLLIMVMAGITMMVFAGGQQSGGQAAQSSPGNQTLDLSKHGSIDVITRGLVAVKNNNAVFDILAKMFNVDLNWDVRPSAGYNDYAQIVLASGDYPDFMEVTFPGGNRTLIENQITSLYEEGVILGLNSLLQKYGQNIENSRPHKTLWATMSDGERPHIPSRYQEDYVERAPVIRKDWLDNLGLEMPTTLDELVEIAKAFTFNDPDGNGINDTMGFGGQEGGWAYECTFYIARSAYGEPVEWKKVGNQYEPWQIREGTREAVKWVRDRYFEGLIDRDFLTILRDQRLERWFQGRYGIYHASMDGFRLNNAWYLEYRRNNPQGVELIMSPIAAPGYTFEASEGLAPNLNNFQIFIFSKTKEAARIVSMIDYLCTDDGVMLGTFGPEGQAWDYVNGVFTPRNLSTEQLLDLGVSCIGNTVYYKWNYIGQSPDMLAQVMAYQKAGGTSKSLLVQDFPSYQGDQSALDPLTNQAFANMMTEPNINVDAAFAQFRAEYLRNGGQAMINYMTQNFNATLK